MNRYHLLSVLACLFILGCGSEPPLGKVVGQVTFHGHPVTAGTVVFTDLEGGRSIVSDLDETGNFVFEVARGYGLPPATYQVAICPPRPNKPSLQYVAPNYQAKRKFPNIPKRYHKEKTSGLSAPVQSGDNPPFIFDLE